jgi:hypothetical protein
MSTESEMGTHGGIYRNGLHFGDGREVRTSYETIFANNKINNNGGAVYGFVTVTTLRQESIDKFSEDKQNIIVDCMNVALGNNEGIVKKDVAVVVYG